MEYLLRTGPSKRDGSVWLTGASLGEPGKAAVCSQEPQDMTEHGKMHFGSWPLHWYLEVQRAYS